MKTILTILTLVLALGTAPAYAHHMAEGIVDEEIYSRIDAMVADTPHADLTLEELGSGMTGMTITVPSLRWLELMIDDGLLTYVAMLDDLVDVAIAFNEDQSVIMTVTRLDVE